MVLHSTLIRNHVPYAGTFATEADRLNATGLSDTDLGKEYRQLDNETYWVLVSVDPLLWRVKGGRSVTETIADITIYLDSADGDDQIGDGSADRPFQTFTRSVRDLPDRIRHVVKLVPTAGTYTDFPDLFDQPARCFGDGKIVIDGTGNPYPVVAGPYTISAVTPVGDAGPYGPSLAYDLQVSTPGWTTDQYWGKFIRLTSGPDAGQIFSIFKNTSDMIRVPPGSLYVTFIPGLTFEIIEEPVLIEVDHRIYFAGQYSVSSYQLYGYDQAPTHPFLIFGGVRIKVTNKKDPLIFDRVNVFAVFSSFVDGYTTDNNSVPVRLIRSNLNGTAIDPNLLIDNEIAKYYWIWACIVVCRNGNPPTASGIDLGVESANLSCITARRSVEFRGGPNNTITFSLIGGVGDVERSVIQLLYIFIEHVGYNNSAIENRGADFFLSGVWVEKCNIPFDGVGRGLAVSDWFRGNTANILNDYAYVGEYGHIFVLIGSGTTIKGQIGAIHFKFGNVYHVDWPPSDVAYTDNGGTYVERRG